MPPNAPDSMKKTYFLSPAIAYSAKNHYLCGSLNVRDCMRWHCPCWLGGKVGAKKGTFFVNHQRMKATTFFVPPA